MTPEPLKVLPDLHDFTRAELDLVLRWLRQRCDVLAYERLQILCLTAAKDESSLPEEARERLENLRTEESAARRCIIAVKLEVKGKEERQGVTVAGNCATRSRCTVTPSAASAAA